MTGAPYVELSVQAGDDPAICSGHKAGTPLPLCDHQHRYIGHKDRSNETAPAAFKELRGLNSVIKVRPKPDIYLFNTLVLTGAKIAQSTLYNITRSANVLKGIKK